jgi:UDP-glucose 4-epimerase
VKILITGGAGYLGSLTARALESASHRPVILDSLVSGPRAFVRDRIFYRGDIADRPLLRRILADHTDIEATLHMAGRVDVPESSRLAYAYYRDNLAKSLELFDELVALGKPRVVFSSTAALYAPPSDGFEVTETSALAPMSPYGRTKLAVEMALHDMGGCTALQAVILRYFNPIGSDPDLQSGVHTRNPSHALPRIVQAARGRTDAFTISGTDHPTRDGTGIRDYIPAWDLALAHVQAIERFDEVVATPDSPTTVINLGTGAGVTVRELVRAVENVLGRPVPVRDGPARPGDAVGAYANVEKARALLGWTAERTLEDGIRSEIAWSDRRPTVLGYP